MVSNTKGDTRLATGWSLGSSRSWRHPISDERGDCMGAGVQMADPAVTAGDLVWVRDEEHGKPLALGIAMVDGEEMVTMNKGKAINTLHWVGDDLWNLDQ